MTYPIPLSCVLTDTSLNISLFLDGVLVEDVSLVDHEISVFRENILNSGYGSNDVRKLVHRDPILNWSFWFWIGVWNRLVLRKNSNFKDPT
jgi:hypothetical protein